jgi:hypothetical protein
VIRDPLVEPGRCPFVAQISPFYADLLVLDPTAMPERCRDSEHTSITKPGSVIRSAAAEAGGASATYHNGLSEEETKRGGRWVSDVWKVKQTATSR